MGSDRLNDYLAAASEDLPTVPQVASQVIDAIDDEDSSVDDVRRLIEQDPALAARILKVSNSSVYSFATEIRTLDQAVALLGGRTVRNLVMAVALRETYRNFGSLEKLLWEHSAAAGPVTSALAARVGGCNPDEAFTVGLLHDLGKAALANSHREEYLEVFERANATQRRFSDVEREIFGFDHAELGGKVAEQWKLPERIVAVVRHHHDPDALNHLAPEVARLTATVSVATACLSRLGSGRPSEIAELDPTQLAAWHFLGLTEDDVDDVLELCTERIEAARAISG